MDGLIRDAQHKVFRILDNLKVHYLNPDEHRNADLKQGIGSKVPVRTKTNLKKATDRVAFSYNPE